MLIPSALHGYWRYGHVRESGCQVMCSNTPMQEVKSWQWYRKNNIILVGWDVSEMTKTIAEKKQQQKNDAIQSEFGGNYQLLLCFSCERDKDVFLLKTDNGRTFRAEISYLEVFQTNRSGKENNLQINQLWCPNFHPNPDLNYFRWQQSLVPDSQTHCCLWIFFTHLGVRGKVGWANSGWGYPGSLLQTNQEYFGV